MARATTFEKTTFSNLASKGSKNGMAHVLPISLRYPSDILAISFRYPSVVLTCTDGRRKDSGRISEGYRKDIGRILQVRT